MSSLRGAVQRFDELEILVKELSILQHRLRDLRFEIMGKRGAVEYLVTTRMYHNTVALFDYYVKTNTMTRHEADEQLRQMLLPLLHPYDVGKEQFVERVLRSPLKLNYIEWRREQANLGDDKQSDESPQTFNRTEFYQNLQNYDPEDLDPDFYAYNGPHPED